ncbi:hypothetical protein [Bdellovibrio sp. HCB337]|uniref:hypothetical protein n=1 Tax=Bdellovibrio sp. HCB337 TaxID=3394358 RepID=UPI0039A6FC53
MRVIVFCVLTSLLAISTQAQEFVSEEAAAERPLRIDEFDNIAKLLHAGKLAPHMKCDLKVRSIKEERRFSTGKKLVEILEITYYPRGLFADTKIKVLIPAEIAKYGTKYVSNHWSGAGEEIKIEAHDGYDHWLRVIHDGKGGIVFFSLGNRLATYPCMVK